MTPQVFTALLIAFSGGVAFAVVSVVFILARAVREPAFAAPFFRTLQKMAAPGIDVNGCPVCRQTGSPDACRHGVPWSEPCLNCHLES